MRRMGEIKSKRGREKDTVKKEELGERGIGCVLY